MPGLFSRTVHLVGAAAVAAALVFAFAMVVLAHDETATPPPEPGIAQPSPIISENPSVGDPDREGQGGIDEEDNLLAPMPSDLPVPDPARAAAPAEASTTVNPAAIPALLSLGLVGATLGVALLAVRRRRVQLR